MENLKKVLEFGKVDANGDGKNNCLVTVEIRLENKGKGPALSICGNVWNPRHTDILQGGQCLDSILEYPELAGNKKYLRVVEIWKRWHLNDMRAGCEHQRNSRDTAKKLTLNEYTWGDKFHEIRSKLTDGEATPEEYVEYKKMLPIVYEHTTNTTRIKYETEKAKELIAAGWIKLEGTKTESANWVRSEEHPEGVLCKPCSICGYRYGSEWLHEELPADIIKEIEEMA